METALAGLTLVGGQQGKRTADALIENFSNGLSDLKRRLPLTVQVQMRAEVMGAEIAAAEAAKKVREAEIAAGVQLDWKGSVKSPAPAAPATDQNNTQTQATRLSQTLSELPAIISGTRRPLEESGSAIQKLRDDLAQAEGHLKAMQATLGLSGDVAEQRKLIVESETRFEKETRELNTATTSEKAKQKTLEQDRVEVQSRIASLSTEEQVKIQSINQAYERQQTLQQTLAQSKAQLVLLQQQYAAAPQEERAGLTRQIAEQQKLLDNTTRLIEEHRTYTDTILQGEANAQKLTELATKEIQLSGQLAVSAENLRAIEADRLELARRRMQLLEPALQANARQASYALQQDNAVLQTQVEGEESVRTQEAIVRQQVNSGSAPETYRVDLAKAQAEYDLKAKQVQMAQEQRTRELAAQEATISALRAQGASQETLTQLEAQRQALLQRDVLLRRQESGQLDDINRKLQEARTIAERPVTSGITQAFRDMAADLPNQFQMAYQITRQAVEELADTISNSIVDAFDPTKKVDLKQRFALFLQDISRMMMNMVVKLLLIRSLMGFMGGGVTGRVDSSLDDFYAGVEGKHEGGPVTGRGTVRAFGFARGGLIPSALPEIERKKKRFDRAHGYALGGRPSGLHPDDTVPIWAAPGEWVIRARSARKYGHSVMAAINEGLIDPLSLQALAHVRSARYVAPRHALGFVEGGSVGRTAPAPATRTAQNVTGVLVADRHLAEQIFANGSQPLLRAIQANRAAMRSILGVS